MSNHLIGPHGIDLTAPGGIEALLDFHRQTFGDARMEVASGDPAASSDPAPGDDPASGSGPAPADPPPGDGLPDDPAALKAMIADLRKENGAARTTAKAKAADEARTQLVTELGKALGLVKDGDNAPTAEQLAAQGQASQAEARQAKVELAVFRTAGTHQGDPNALLDSRAFLAKVADLDPADGEFQAKVDAAVKVAVAENPKLKASQVAARSGTDLTGGTGEGRTTPKSLTDAAAAHYAGGGTA